MSTTSPRLDPTYERYEAQAALVRYMAVALTFCTRWGLKLEWDASKMALLKHLMHAKDEHSLHYAALIEAMVLSKKSPIGEIVVELPSPYHESVFMLCARITAIKGFEEDARRLADLKSLLKIEDYHAELIIDLAKREALLLHVGKPEPCVF